MHFRQIRLARILNKLTKDQEAEKNRMNFNKMKYFMQWKCFSIVPLLEPKEEIDYDENILKLEEK